MTWTTRARRIATTARAALRFLIDFCSQVMLSFALAVALVIGYSLSVLATPFVLMFSIAVIPVLVACGVVLALGALEVLLTGDPALTMLAAGKIFEATASTVSIAANWLLSVYSASAVGVTAFILGGLAIAIITVRRLAVSYIRVFQEIARRTSYSSDEAKAQFFELSGALAMYIISIVYVVVGITYAARVDGSFVVEGTLSVGKALFLVFDRAAQGALLALMNFFGIRLTTLVLNPGHWLYNAYIGSMVYLQFCSLALVGQQLKAFWQFKRGGYSEGNLWGLAARQKWLLLAVWVKGAVSG